MSINAEWHRARPMPKNPTLEQRLEWHHEHALNCACRKPPPKLAEYEKRSARGFSTR